MRVGVILDCLKIITAKIPKYIWILVAILAFELFANYVFSLFLGEKHPLCVHIGSSFILTVCIYILFSIFLFVYSAFSVHKTHIHAFYLIILMILLLLANVFIRKIYDCIDSFYMGYVN